MTMHRRTPIVAALLACVGVPGCVDVEPDAAAGTETTAPATTGTTGAADDRQEGPGDGVDPPADTGTTMHGGTTGSDSSAGVGESGSATGTDTTGETPGTCAEDWPVWDDGSDCAVPTVQIHHVSPDTVILRQSLCTSFEGPFMYLLFGSDRVLLEDTGAGGIMIADAVYGVIDDWLAANGKDSIELVVVNSHAHGDHTQGNGQFAGQPDTQVVGTGVAAVSAYFGIGNWPDEAVEYDLGGRVLDIIPIPGHQTSHIAIYDHQEQWLLTGDTLYPGRLYIADFPAYVASIGRLVDHVAALPTCNVMGTHIEMTNTAGSDFPFGADIHPDEHPLPLTTEHLIELRDGVTAMGGTPSIEPHDDFVIYPL